MKCPSLKKKIFNAILHTSYATDIKFNIAIKFLLNNFSFIAETRTTFLECRQVRDGKASTMMEAVQTSLWNFGVPVAKVAGLRTDAAAVMASELNGLRGLMAEENPFCVHIHCVFHRCHLALSQACKGIGLGADSV